MSDSTIKLTEMENQNSPPSQPLDSLSHEPQSPSSNQQTQKRNHPESPQNETHNEPKRSKNANTTWFPQEIIVDILSNLLVKSLIRFRCVSKSFKALLTDSSFIKKHLKKPNSSKTRALLNTWSYEFKQRKFSIQSCFIKAIFGVPIVIAQELEYPSKIDSHLDRIAGSCNGLICLLTGEDTVLLTNPILKASKFVPDLGFKTNERCYCVIGFGFDALMDDYKVVRVFCSKRNGSSGSNETIVWVYSSRSNCWRRIQDFQFGVPFPEHSPKYVDGCLNYVVSMGSSCIIVSFDLAHEMYKEVMQPCYGNGSGMVISLGVLDGCLCWLCNYGSSYAEVWVMKEYGKEESWSKLVTIPYPDFPGRGVFSAPLFVSESGEILLQFGADWFIYNPEDQLFRTPKIANVVYKQVQVVYEEILVYVDISRYEQVVYKESLVSPNAVDQQHG